MYIFWSLSNKFPRFSELDFSHFTPQVKLFFVEKELEGKPKIFEIKNAMQRGIRKIVTFLKL